MNICSIGTKDFHILIPAFWLIAWISRLTIIMPVVSFSLDSSCIFAVSGFVIGDTFANFAALSAAPMYGFSRRMRKAIAVSVMEAHHGVPARTWMCSRVHSTTAVGPQP